MKFTRWLSIVVVAVTLLAAPVVSLAQGFPSQQGGGQGQGQGGFPSQGGQQPTTGGFFQSTEFGFSLTFGPPWTVVEQFGGPGQGVEGIVVTNGTSGVTVMGANNSNTPQAIVQSAADIIASNTGVAMNFNQVALDEVDAAAAYYLSADNQLGARIHATKLSQSTAFVVIWLFPAALVDSEGDAYNLLVDGLRLL